MCFTSTEENGMRNSSVNLVNSLEQQDKEFIEVV